MIRSEATKRLRIAKIGVWLEGYFLTPLGRAVCRKAFGNNSEGRDEKKAPIRKVRIGAKAFNLFNRLGSSSCKTEFL